MVYEIIDNHLNVQISMNLKFYFNAETEIVCHSCLPSLIY